MAKRMISMIQAVRVTTSARPEMMLMKTMPVRWLMAPYMPTRKAMAERTAADTEKLSAAGQWNVVE